MTEEAAHSHSCTQQHSAHIAHPSSLDEQIGNSVSTLPPLPLQPRTLTHSQQPVHILGAELPTHAHSTRVNICQCCCSGGASCISWHWASNARWARLSNGGRAAWWARCHSCRHIARCRIGSSRRIPRGSGADCDPIWTRCC
jgi:hypothetical protein